MSQTKTQSGGESIRVEEGDLISDGPDDLQVRYRVEATKHLPRNWDRHREPVTEREKQVARREKWARSLVQAVPIVVTTGVALAVTNHLMSKFAGSMTINGEPVAYSGPAELVGPVVLLFLVVAVILHGLKGGLPGMAGRRSVR